MDFGTALGIALTVIFGVLGIYFGVRVVKKKQIQKQAVKGNSMAVQSGRDTNIKGEL